MQWQVKPLTNFWEKQSARTKESESVSYQEMFIPQRYQLMAPSNGAQVAPRHLLDSAHCLSCNKHNKFQLPPNDKAYWIIWQHSWPIRNAKHANFVDLFGTVCMTEIFRVRVLLIAQMN